MPTVSIVLTLNHVQRKLHGILGYEQAFLMERKNLINYNIVPVSYTINSVDFHEMKGHHDIFALEWAENTIETGSVQTFANGARCVHIARRNYLPPAIANTAGFTP